MFRDPDDMTDGFRSRTLVPAVLVCAAVLGSCATPSDESPVVVPDARGLSAGSAMKNGVSSLPWRSAGRPANAPKIETPVARTEPPRPKPTPASVPAEEPLVGEPPADQRRVALIVGNSLYRNIAALRNPVNDAQSLARSLRGRNFEVLVATDQTRSQLDETVREFSQLARGADVALYFYSGHALQVEGRNWMLPIDADIESEADIAIAANPMDAVFDQMSNRAKTSIVFLDACRNNPFASQMSSAHRSGGGTRGLVRPEVGEGEIYIAFATAPGEVALDGSGDNSPFTTALLEHLETPGIELEELMRRVRKDVQERTAGAPIQQRPWGNSSLTERFYF